MRRCGAEEREAATVRTRSTSSRSESPRAAGASARPAASHVTRARTPPCAPSPRGGRPETTRNCASRASRDRLQSVTDTQPCVPPGLAKLSTSQPRVADDNCDSVIAREFS